MIPYETNPELDKYIDLMINQELFTNENTTTLLPGYNVYEINTNNHSYPIPENIAKEITGNEYGFDKLGKGRLGRLYTITHGYDLRTVFAESERTDFVNYAYAYLRYNNINFKDFLTSNGINLNEYIYEYNYMGKFIENGLFLDKYIGAVKLPTSFDTIESIDLGSGTPHQLVNKYIKNNFGITLVQYIEKYANDHEKLVFLATKVVKTFHTKYDCRQLLVKYSGCNITDMHDVLLYECNDVNADMDEILKIVKLKLNEVNNYGLDLTYYYKKNPTEEEYFNYIMMLHDIAPKTGYLGEEFNNILRYKVKKYIDPGVADRVKKRYMNEVSGIPKEHLDEAIKADQYLGPIEKFGIHFFAHGRGGAYGPDYAYEYKKELNFARHVTACCPELKGHRIRKNERYAEIDERYLTTLEQLEKDLYLLATPEVREKEFMHMNSDVNNIEDINKVILKLLHDISNSKNLKIISAYDIKALFKDKSDSINIYTADTSEKFLRIIKKDSEYTISVDYTNDETSLCLLSSVILTKADLNNFLSELLECLNNDKILSKYSSSIEGLIS